MLEELSRPALGSRVMAESLMKRCLILLLRDHMERLGARSPLFGPLVDPRLARAVAAVIAQPAYPHSVKSLAATAGMSRSTFSAVSWRAMSKRRWSSCKPCGCAPPLACCKPPSCR
jgi:AraC family transcriptional activator of mtrCDE